MQSDIKQINTNVKLCCCTLTFHKVVQHQISGEVVVLILVYSAVHF